MNDWQAEIYKFNARESARADHIVGVVSALGLVVLIYLILVSP